MRTSIHSSALLVVLAALTADAHPRGFHKKVVLTAYRTRIEGLLSMDVDGSERTRGLRAAADLDGDGKLSQPELKELRDRVVKLAIASLKLEISGAKIPVEVKEAKLSVHDDFSTGPSGLSIAVLLMMKHPYEVKPGMTLVVEDRAPDLSEVPVEVYLAGAGDAGVQVEKSELKLGDKLSVRLGALAE